MDQKNIVLKEMPEGCKFCVKGQKLVLFVTGFCDRDCWYCTTSPARWQKDLIFANDRRVKKDQDVLEEAEAMKAKGAGLTGGEPLKQPDRTIHYIEMLKERFGDDFHIHMYTNGDALNRELVERLHKAGLDEIRLHHSFDKLYLLSGYDWDFGVEIPCVPGEKEKIKDVIKELDNYGGFLNLNELEFSDRNQRRMENREFEGVDWSNCVKGSRELGKEVIRWAKENGVGIGINFCTSWTKNNLQLLNRLKRRAENVKQPFEKVTKDGMIEKGVVFDEGAEKYLKRYRWRKGRMETSVERAVDMAKKGFKSAIVLEYPSAEPFDFELTYLDDKGKLIETL